MLFDTDILIWFLRGNRKAAAFIDEAKERSVSIVSYMELLQGIRDKEEFHELKRFLLDFGFQMVPINEAIGQRAVVYLEEHGLSSRLCMADALIAATAAEHTVTLATGNRKHFSAIRDIETKAFLP